MSSYAESTVELMEGVRRISEFSSSSLVCRMPGSMLDVQQHAAFWCRVPVLVLSLHAIVLQFMF